MHELPCVAKCRGRLFCNCRTIFTHRSLLCSIVLTQASERTPFHHPSTVYRTWLRRPDYETVCKGHLLGHKAAVANLKLLLHLFYLLQSTSGSRAGTSTTLVPLSTTAFPLQELSWSLQSPTYRLYQRVARKATIVAVFICISAVRGRMPDLMGIIFGLHRISERFPFSEYTKPACDHNLSPRVECLAGTHACKTLELRCKAQQATTRTSVESQFTSEHPWMSW
eukprot:6478472-Amphidinium_carterae.1